jgi:hypothetical protein
MAYHTVGQGVHAIIDEDFTVDAENVQRMLRDWHSLTPMISEPTERESAEELIKRLLDSSSNNT